MGDFLNARSLARDETVFRHHIGMLRSENRGVLLVKSLTILLQLLLDVRLKFNASR